MNFKDVFKKFEAAVETGTAHFIAKASNVADEFCSICKKADIADQQLEALLESPVGSGLAAMLPQGNTERLVAIALLKRFHPILQTCGDPVVVNACKLRIAAEITFIESKAFNTIDAAILGVQQLFQPL